MKVFQIEEMTNGWFAGSFSPTAFETSKFEAAIKNYQKGDSEQSHHHKLATEITVVVSGVVRMLNQDWGPGTVIVLDPGESTPFLCLEDATTFVIKTPSVTGDKYFD